MTLSPGLKKLITTLDQYKSLNGELVESIISTMHLQPDDLETYAELDHPATISYGRKTVYENDRFKVLIISWIPGDYTAIHNHGSSEWGCILHFGLTVHRVYEFREQVLSLASARLFDQGEVCVLDSSLIHLMGNDGNQGTVSLHIYGKPELMGDSDDLATVFQPENKKLLKTQGEAYLQLDRNSIKDEKKFTAIEPATLVDYLGLVKQFYVRNGNQEMLRKISHYAEHPERYLATEPNNYMNRQPDEYQNATNNLR